MRFRKWLIEHWAETLFLIAITLAMYYILKGAGYFS